MQAVAHAGRDTLRSSPMTAISENDEIRIEGHLINHIREVDGFMLPIHLPFPPI